MMGNIGKELEKHAKRLGIEKQVEAVGVVEQATEVIAEFIPKEDFEVVSFKEGVLKLWVKSSSVSSEIMGEKNKLKDLGINRVTFSGESSV